MLLHANTTATFNLADIYRLASVTDAAGTSATYGYGDTNSQMMELPTSVTDPYGTVTTSAYDANGRVTQTSVADSADLMYTYSNGDLSTVKRTGSGNSAQTYGFTYDSFGNMLTAKVGSRTLVTNTYGAGNGLLTKQTYGNSDSVSYTYDSLGRVKAASYSNRDQFAYCYNGEGRLHSAEQNDQNNIYTYLYNYDSLGRLISSEKLMDGDPILQESQTYNSNNQLTSTGWRVDGESFSEKYTYNASDGSLNTITMSSGDTLTMGYDGLRRLSSVSGGLGARNYSYNDKTASTTTLQVKSITYPELGNLTFTYTYDSNGNIATYTAPGKGTITYTYDDMGQLTGATGSEGYLYSYGYDDVGNITSISDPFADTILSYESGDWKDLISERVTYDEVGNPLVYMNGTFWMDLTWRGGRLLASADAGDGPIFFTYDINGIRTSKSIYNITYEYVYSGDKLLRQTWEITEDGELWNLNSIDFFYDGNGTPYAMKYNGEMYYYVTNLQGDVIMVVNSNGETVAEYEYSPYGMIISSVGELSYINPLRYRGYVYDEETGLYYLNSRYYDPQFGRFINADSFIDIGSSTGHNLFTYCENNPVNKADPSGEDGKVIELGSNWYCRIDSAVESAGTQRHIHIWNERKNVNYAQNEDGSPHDKGKNSQGKLPKWLQKAIQSKTGWDYNGKRNTFFKDTNCEYWAEGVHYTFADGTTAVRANSPFLRNSVNSFEQVYFQDEVQPNVLSSPAHSFFYPLFVPNNFPAFSFGFGWGTLPLPFLA